VILTAEVQDSGRRLDAFLRKALPDYSRSRLQFWIRDKRVLVDGSVTRGSYILRGGESIAVTPGEPPPLKAEPEDLPLRVLYQDADVVVVDKQAGMVVHPGAGHERGTLVNALLHHFGSLPTSNSDLRPGIVHRLDRETSGALVVARTHRAHQALAAQFHNREVEKTYLALVHGRMSHAHGRIASPISRDPVRRVRMTARLATGRAALTEYRALEQFAQFSYLEVRIGTGRTHQIRVHLSSIGRPIVGDRLYGAPATLPGLPVLGRFFLHAHRLRFRSPSSGEWITIESPLPPALSSFLEALRTQHG